MHDGTPGVYCTLFIRVYGRSKGGIGDILCKSVRVFKLGICDWSLDVPCRYPTAKRRGLSKKQELAFVNFNITAGVYLSRFGMEKMPNTWFFVDLTPLFHWNTKQLFLYLEAEYTNGQAVSFAIWDVVPLILSFLRWIILPVCLGSDHKRCSGRC